MPTQWSEAEQVPLGCIAPHTAPAVSFRASDRRHWRGNPFPFSHASGGLFSFSSERKEEKKRRQKLRFWISLRGFTWFLLCLFLPRERCAMQISPKCCIASAPLSAAAFALKCKAAQFYVSTRKHLQKQRPKAATYLCRFAAKARFDNRPNPRVRFPKGRAAALPLWSFQGDRIFKERGKSKSPFP